MDSEKVMTILEWNPKKSVAKVAGALELNSCKKRVRRGAELFRCFYRRSMLLHDYFLSLAINYNDVHAASNVERFFCAVECYCLTCCVVD